MLTTEQLEITLQDTFARIRDRRPEVQRGFEWVVLARNYGFEVWDDTGFQWKLAIDNDEQYMLLYPKVLDHLVYAEGMQSIQRIGRDVLLVGGFIPGTDLLETMSAGAGRHWEGGLIVNFDWAMVDNWQDGVALATYLEFLIGTDGAVVRGCTRKIMREDNLQAIGMAPDRLGTS